MWSKTPNPPEPTVPPFTLGADPEFVCLNRSRALVCAWQTPFRSQDHEVGGDHSGRPFEVRPEPSECPLKVVSSMRDMLLTHTLRYPGFYSYTWAGGSFYETDDGMATPIGGHIHVGGLDDDLVDMDLAVELMDSYVGSASVLLEDRKMGMKRRGTAIGGLIYGLASDVRAQPYGFEYRTPASWVESPHVAASLMCLTKVVLHEALLDAQKPDGDPDAIFTFPSHIAKSIKSMDTKRLRDEWVDAWKSLQRMALFPRYHRHLNLLNFLISRGLTWHPAREMKEAWGIPVPAQCIAPSVELQSIWAPIGPIQAKTRRPKRKVASKDGGYRTVRLSNGDKVQVNELGIVRPVPRAVPADPQVRRGIIRDQNLVV